MTLKFTLAVLLGLAAPSPALAQGGIFSDPKNLQVLPRDITPAELGATMRGFAMGTGLRCSNCHVGEEDQDLSAYDFAADTPELKQTARAMLRMVKAINETHLAGLGDERMEVSCVTCHRGVRIPRTTEQVLLDAAAEGSAPQLEATYRELRERYYGTHSYDFSERTLVRVAQALLGSGDRQAAGTVLDLMLEADPRSFNAHYLYGDYHAAGDDPEAAARYYRQAIAINPAAAPLLQGRLDALQVENP